jgi:hypothetical protein
MSFIVETGAGLSTANSYLSVADANTYHTDHSGSTSWSGASQADKEKALRLATQYIDARYDGRWKGSRSNEDQALAWPRANVVDSDGYILDSDDLPARLEHAVGELALRVLEGDTLFDDISEPGSIASETIVAGPVEFSQTYVGGKSQVKSYPLIDMLVRPLIQDSNIMERG